MRGIVSVLSILLASLLGVASLLPSAGLAQDTKRPVVERPFAPAQDLKRVFKNYERMRLDTAEAARQIRQTGRLSINTEHQRLELELEPHDLRAEGYVAEETIADGVRLPVKSDGPVRTFKGRVRGKNNAQARFTVDEESFEGSILTPEERYYIEPARRYLSSADPSEFLFYKATDVIETEPATCAVSLHEKVSEAADKMGEVESISSAIRSGEPVMANALAAPLEAQLATEADFEYVTALGGSVNANNEILSIMNQVEGVYQAEIGLSFSIVHQHTWATSADPYTTVDPVLALKEFTNYWNANFQAVQRDLAHMWTGKDLTSTAGVGWSGVVCGAPESAYSLSERLIPAPQKYVLPAHEIGHNFGASHTDSNAACANTIMQSVATDNSVISFCQTSRDQITSFINANSSCLSPAPACTYSITPTNASFTSAGGTGTVAVTASGGCAWTAQSNVPWITVTAGANGVGSGTVSYSVAANTAPTARTGTINVAGNTFTVTQAAASCTYSISPTSASFASAGGTGSTAVTTTAGCAWAATSNAPWITITAGATGNGSGTVSYSVAANTATSSRTGTLNVAGNTFTVTQAAAACTFSISPTSASFSSAAGTGTVTVTAASGCAWAAKSNVTWITVTAGASGTGNGTVSYSVAANTAPTARTGTLNVAGKTFTVTQAAAPCTYSISPTSASFASAGGTGSITVTTTAGCAWAVRSNAAWITVTAGATGNGNGTVSYSVAANTVPTSRTGTLNVAGKIFTVTQAAAPCTYTITPTSASFTSAAGTGTITVTAPAGCVWAVRSNAPWITVTAGATGSGNGTVSYSVAANTTTSSRAGTLNVAGKIFTVTQAAAPCNFSISPASASFGSAGGTGSITVTTTAGCAWAAKSNVSWITVTAGATGSGSGTVSYSVAANTATISRTGTLNVAGKTFTVTQGPAPCTYSISPTSAMFVSGGGTSTITVTTTVGCIWAVRSNAPWITVTAGATGTGSGIVRYSVAANTATTSRAGTLNVAGKIFTVTQAAAPPTVSSLVLNPTLVAGCKAVLGTVTINAPAPANGLAVTLSDTLASVTVPSSVIVPAGATSKAFTITTVPVSASQSGTVTAQTGTVTRSAALTVRPIGVFSLALNPNPVTGGSDVTGTVTLECPAAPSNIVVSLSSSNSTVAAPAVSSITIPTGATTKTFTVHTTQVASTTSVIISATANGIGKSATLTVNPGEGSN